MTFGITVVTSKHGNLLKIETTNKRANVQMTIDDKTYEFQQICRVGQRYYPHSIPVVSRKFHFPNISTKMNHLHYLGPNDGFQYISEFFDVDFCKLAFDGTKLYVYNWQDIWKKSSILDWKKYVRTHISSFVSEKPELYWVYAALENRRSKYKARGFQIRIKNVDPRGVKMPSVPLREPSWKVKTRFNRFNNFKRKWQE